MKLAILVCLTMTLSACAGNKPVRRVESVGDSLRRDPDSLRTGVYTDKNGKNLYLVVENLKEAQQANERKLSDLARSLDYWKRQNETLTSGNDRLRVGITQKAEDEAVAAELNTPPQDTARTPASVLPKTTHSEPEGL